MTQGAGPSLTCPSCGHENPLDAQFCAQCGTALRDGTEQAHNHEHGAGLTCPRCHEVNEPGSRFCYNCGLPFDDRMPAGGIPSSIAAFTFGRPGGFWMRFVATIIDSFILSAVLFAVFSTFTESYLSSEEWSAWDIASLGVDIAYAGIAVAVWSTTIGKRVFAAYILRPDGSRVSFGRALGREAFKLLLPPLFIVSIFMVAIRQDKRALHDLVADTVVIAR